MPCHRVHLIAISDYSLSRQANDKTPLPPYRRTIAVLVVKPKTRRTALRRTFVQQGTHGGPARAQPAKAT
jgi:hypothetical protein